MCYPALVTADKGVSALRQMSSSERLSGPLACAVRTRAPERRWTTKQKWCLVLKTTITLYAFMNQHFADLLNMISFTLLFLPTVNRITFSWLFFIFLYIHTVFFVTPTSVVAHSLCSILCFPLDWNALNQCAFAYLLPIIVEIKLRCLVLTFNEINMAERIQREKSPVCVSSIFHSSLLCLSFLS